MRITQLHPRRGKWNMTRALPARRNTTSITWWHHSNGDEIGEKKKHGIFWSGFSLPRIRNLVQEPTWLPLTLIGKKRRRTLGRWFTLLYSGWESLLFQYLVPHSAQGNHRLKWYSVDDALFNRFFFFNFFKTSWTATGLETVDWTRAIWCGAEALLLTVAYC